MKRLPDGIEVWFAWHPVECGALGTDGWTWLQWVIRVPGIVNVYQRITKINKEMHMKSHRTKEQRFASLGFPEHTREVFYAGWYAAGNEINEGEDYDDFQERLYANDFLKRDDDADE